MRLRRRNAAVVLATGIGMLLVAVLTLGLMDVTAWTALPDVQHVDQDTASLLVSEQRSATNLIHS